MMDPDATASGFRDLGRTDALGRAVRAGDRGSFPELFERVMPALHVWIEIRIRRGPPGRAETQDILQEVWMRALEGFGKYDPARSFRGWILGIAKNVLLQTYAKSSPAPLAAPAGADASTPEIPDSITSVSMRLSRDDSIRRFLEYVAELAPEERALLLYCGIEEYTSAQAAARLGISSDAANKRWQALRARMRQNGALEALSLELGG